MATGLTPSTCWATVRGMFGTPAGTRTAYEPCVGPLGLAALRHQHVQHSGRQVRVSRIYAQRPRAVRVSLVLDRHLRHGLVVRLAPGARHPVRVLIVGRPGGRPRRAQRRASHSWSRRPRAFDVGPEKLAASEEPRDRLHTVRDVRVPAASWRQSKHRHEALHLLRLHRVCRLCCTPPLQLSASRQGRQAADTSIRR